MAEAKRSGFERVLFVLLLLLLVPALLMQFPESQFLFALILELAAPFQLLVGIALLATVFASMRLQLLGFVLLLLSAVPSPPVAELPSGPVTGGREGRVELWLANLRSSNRHHSLVIDALKEQRPQLAFLMEVDTEWAKSLESLAELYPHRLLKPREDNFGIACLSRIAPEVLRVQAFGAAGLPSIELSIRSPSGRPLHFVLTHPLPPLSGQFLMLRDQQLRDAARRCRELGARCVLLGDLNSTLPSQILRSICKRAGLRAASASPWKGTWPTHIPSFLRIRIDHCLVGSGVQVLDAEIGSAIGSDHLPLRVLLR